MVTLLNRLQELPTNRVECKISYWDFSIGGIWQRPKLFVCLRKVTIVKNLLRICLTVRDHSVHLYHDLRQTL